MAAMVRPVCINHSDFRYSRVAMLAFEVFAAKFNIRKVHCKSIFVYKCLELIFVKLRKSRKSFNACRNVVIDTQRFGLFKRSLTALYGVYYILFDSLKLCRSKLAEEHIYFCGANGRLVAFRNYLNTLSTGVRPLVKLTRQIFNCKYRGVGLRQASVGVVKLRL